MAWFMKNAAIQHRLIEELEEISLAVRDQLVVEYSTGIALSTSFQIVDALGNVVKELATPVVPSGVYLFETSTESLANGLYFLRMNSGPYVASTQFVIVR